MLDHIPVEPFHPGLEIADELEARGWTQDDLAEITNISRRQIGNLITGKSGVTAETALALAQAFGHEAKTWMELQMVYELALASKTDRDIARRAKLFSKLPIREMQKRLWLRRANILSDVSELESEVKAFLQVKHIDDTPAFELAARKSTGYDHDTPAQLAWYARAHQLATAAPATKYDEAKLPQAFAELKQLAQYPEDSGRVPKVLAEHGIRFLVIEHLPKSKIDGAAFWINEESPVVALSLRYDRIDNFWHNLIHEMIHIKYRDKSRVDVDISVSETAAELPECEKRANAEASEFLVPRERLESLARRYGSRCSEADIVRASQTSGIRVHPGILVGQLQGRGALDYRYHRKLLVGIRSNVVDNALTDGWGHIPPV